MLTSISEMIVKFLSFKGKKLEKVEDKQLDGKTLEIGHFDICNDNLLLAARKKIFGIEPDREKLRAEVLELKNNQLRCFYDHNNE